MAADHLFNAVQLISAGAALFGNAAEGIESDRSCEGFVGNDIVSIPALQVVVAVAGADGVVTQVAKNISLPEVVSSRSLAVVPKILAISKKTKGEGPDDVCIGCPLLVPALAG